MALIFFTVIREMDTTGIGRTLMVIYASNERDEGGYIAYTLDGTPVSNHC